MRNLIICSLLPAFLAIPSLHAEEKIDFATQIYPFLKSGCIQCHREPYEYESRGRMRMRSPKADIILATKEGILNSLDGDDEKILVPGDPDASRILEVTLLPIYDDMHFPPEGDAPQWTDAEKELFAKWISEGADFGDWTKDEEPELIDAYIEAWDVEKTEKEADTIETFDSGLWKEIKG